MSKYETIAGYPSRGETYAKIIDLCDQLQDQCAVMSHLHNTEGNPTDVTLARGWLGMTELIKRMRHQLTQLAIGRMQ